MNMKIKALLLLLCAVAVVIAAAFGTLAYLTDKDANVNTFTVGKVGLKLDEADVNPDGTYVKDSETRVQENEYHLLPGHTYIKDPTVTMDTDSEDAYVRIMVEAVYLEGLKKAMPQEKDDFKNFYQGDMFLLQMLCLDEKGNNTWRNDVWECHTFHESGPYTGCYEFRYKPNNGIVPKGTTELAPLFTRITVPGEIDNAGIAELKDVEIVVVAEAIQAAGFDSADAAWKAFEAQNPVALY